MQRKQKALKPLRLSTSQGYFSLLLHPRSALSLPGTPGPQSRCRLEHCHPPWPREKENHVLAFKASTPKRHSSLLFAFIVQSAKASHVAMPSFKGGREQEMICHMPEGRTRNLWRPARMLRQSLQQRRLRAETLTFWPLSHCPSRAVWTQVISA